MVRVGPFVVPSRATLASDFWEVAPGRSPPLPQLLVGAGHYLGAGTSPNAQSAPMNILATPGDPALFGIHNISTTFRSCA
jgi:hypothetical protein